MMLSITRTPPDVVYAKTALPSHLHKRAVSERPPETVGDIPAAQQPADVGARSVGSPLTERFSSLVLGTPESSVNTGPAASTAACLAHCCAANNSACELKSALTALAYGGACSPEQLATLKKQYGSLRPLIPFLGKTFEGCDNLTLLDSDDEWLDFVKQYPLMLAKVPKDVLRYCDSLYVEALCASKGSAEVIKLLPKGHKGRICRRAFVEDPALLALLPASERTAERCKEACIKHPQVLADVPKDILTEEFLAQLCDGNSDCFRYLTDDQKTKELAMLVCQRDGTLLALVRPEWRDKALCRVACRSDASALSSVPEEICTEAFCEWLAGKSEMALKYIPTDKLTPTMCEKACTKWPEEMEFVPVDLQTEDLFRSVLKSRRRRFAYPFLPSRFVSAEECRQLCETSGAHLDCVPDALKDDTLCSIASKDEHWNLYEVPVPRRSRALCLKSALAAPCNFVYVPDQHINLEFLFSVTGGQDNLDLHIRAQKLLSDEDYTLFLCVSALHRTKTQLKLLTWPKLPDHFRERLIDFLAGQGEPISVLNLPKHELINPHNPLCFQLQNPFVSKLLLQAHTARHYRPACEADGQAWLHYLEEQLPRYCNSPLPLIDAALYAPLQTGHIEPLGGRTLQVKSGDRIDYYKFQREDEPLTDLLREGLIHQFRAENPQGAWSKLASDLPKDPHFFALPQSMWPCKREKFKDEVKVHTASGREPWINVYRYTASADYGRYAHQPDREADCLWKKPEEAILTACSDMGLFASMGLMLTSMLPAMHNSTDRRSWQTLYGLFGYRRAVDLHPGTLGAWNGTATEHCDIGFNGLRDVGDYEQFGAIQSCFSKSDDDGTAQPAEIGQRLSVVSTLCDNVMAALLIRSRLRQPDCDYHYGQEKTLTDTADFINDVLDHLLSGLAGKGKSEVQPGITRKTMVFDDSKDDSPYDEWLQRVALEVVYWTARQPELNSGKLAVLGQPKVDYDPQDCWSVQVKEHNNLSGKLYDTTQFRPVVGNHRVPDNFRNCDFEDNLGAGNQTFPLTSLVQGLTSLGGDILMRPALRPSTQADDTAMETDSREMR